MEWAKITFHIEAKEPDFMLDNVRKCCWKVALLRIMLSGYISKNYIEDNDGICEKRVLLLNQWNKLVRYCKIVIQKNLVEVI